MANILFNQAQKALSHLRNPRQGPKPPLLGVKGWEKSKKVYHLKDDIERAFKTELDRLSDLQKEANQILQVPENEGRPKLNKGEQEKLNPIKEEIEELGEVEKEIELTGGKLTEEEFGDVIDSGIFIDLEFAIEMETKED